MKWSICFHNKFEIEFDKLSDEVQDEMLAQLLRLEKFGPALGRPHVDTLKNSKYSNMKELRFKTSDSVWRVAFAFDPKREAIVLVAGNKSGIGSDRFYRDLIKKADQRFSEYLSDLNKWGE